MKKTLTINLNGSVFHIDEDAFQRLNGYLNAIDKHFPNAEDKEILRDIEARVAELFSEKLNTRNVVEIADVENVISVLGQPNQFGGEEENTSEQPKNEQNEKQQETKKTARKLYRDPDHQVFGGVFAGIAAYFGIDVVWLRILAVICVIFSFGSPILLYIIAWIIMPEAKTAAQKLEMRGEAVTVDSIKSYFESEQFHENANKVGSKFSEIFLIFVKIFLVFWGVIATIVGFSIILGLVTGAVFLIFSDGWRVFETNIMFNSIFWSAVALVCIIPAIGMFFGGIRLIKNRSNPQNMQKRSSIFGWTMLAVWFISLAVLIACAIRGVNINSEIFWNKIDADKNIEYVYENSTVPAFNKINVADGFEVELVAADTTFIENSNARYIQTYVKNGVLHIKSNADKKHWWKHFKQDYRKVIVHLQKIDEIKTENACNIYSNTPLKTENFVLDVENACKVRLDVEAQYVKINCENACKLNMAIDAKDVRIDCENACKIDMDLKAQNVRFKGENSVNAKLNVDTDNLEIDVENSCSISLHGTTKVLKTNKAHASNINTDNLTQITH